MRGGDPEPQWRRVAAASANSIGPIKLIMESLAREIIVIPIHTVVQRGRTTATALRKALIIFKCLSIYLSIYLIAQSLGWDKIHRRMRARDRPIGRSAIVHRTTRLQTVRCRAVSPSDDDDESSHVL